LIHGRQGFFQARLAGNRYRYVEKFFLSFAYSIARAALRLVDDAASDKERKATNKIKKPDRSTACDVNANPSKESYTLAKYTMRDHFNARF